MPVVKNGGPRGLALESEHSERAIDVPSTFIPAPKEKPRLAGATSQAVDGKEKIKKYQDELRIRSEKEHQILLQQDFLRDSLRGSKKLQNLETSPVGSKESHSASTGLVNEAFDQESETKGGNSKTASLHVTEGIVQQDGIEIHNILALLQALRSKLGVNSSEVRLMSQLFNSVKFQDAVTLYNKMKEVGGAEQDTLFCEARSLSRNIVSALKNTSDERASQLYQILDNPLLQGLLLSHDIIASAQLELRQVDDEAIAVDKAGKYKEKTVKIVTVLKTADPLGATVRNDGESVVIGRIVKGGVAEKSRLLHEEDEILEINGTPLRGKTINEVSDMLAGMTGPLQFVIVPGGRGLGLRTLQEKEVAVRALFSYDPEDDIYIPCQELGISFQTGDILHIINQSDPNWWQAYREGEDDQALAGLIPSKSFWETSENVRLQIMAKTRESEAQQGCCPSRRKRRRKSDIIEDGDEEILTYEEVTLLYPDVNKKRPVVLIGPPDVGRKELREKLLECEPERFAAAIPHTSRPRREDEIDGKDYHFTARHIFEADIRSNKFVEHGLYQRDYYGTSVEAILTVVAARKTCVLNLHPQALKILRTMKIMPYVIFIAPPSMEKLRMNILKSGRDSSVEVCKNIIDKGREMETKHAHLFDFIIRNDDLDNAYRELLMVIDRLDREPHWVPSEWLHKLA